MASTGAGEPIQPTPGRSPPLPIPGPARRPSSLGTSCGGTSPGPGGSRGAGAPGVTAAAASSASQSVSRTGSLRRPLPLAKPLPATPLVSTRDYAATSVSFAPVVVGGVQRPRGATPPSEGNDPQGVKGSRSLTISEFRGGPEGPRFGCASSPGGPPSSTSPRREVPGLTRTKTVPAMPGEEGKGKSGHFGKIRRVLGFFFKRRPKAQELQERNVLLASPEVDGHLHEQSRRLTRFMAADNLRKSLTSRAAPVELISKGIIMEEDAPRPLPPRDAQGGKKVTFGISPDELVRLYPDMEGGVPKVLWDCADPIMRELDAEGLFRVPGASDEIAELKKYAEERGEVKFSIVHSVHSLCGLMGHFFRSLPEPLLTYEIYDDLLNVGISYSRASAGPDSTAAALASLKALLQRIPHSNYMLLRWFLELLYMVTQLARKNKMAPENISTVFGPTLIRPREENLETIGKLRYHSLVLELMVRFYTELFPVDPNEQPPPALLSTARQLPPALRNRLNPTSPRPPPGVTVERMPTSQLTAAALNTSGGASSTSSSERQSRIRSNSESSVFSFCSPRQTVQVLPAAYGAVLRSIAAARVTYERTPSPLPESHGRSSPAPRIDTPAAPPRTPLPPSPKQRPTPAVPSPPVCTAGATTCVAASGSNEGQAPKRRPPPPLPAKPNFASRQQPSCQKPVPSCGTQVPSVSILKQPAATTDDISSRPTFCTLPRPRPAPHAPVSRPLPPPPASSGSSKAPPRPAPAPPQQGTSGTPPQPIGSYSSMSLNPGRQHWEGNQQRSIHNLRKMFESQQQQQQ